MSEAVARRRGPGRVGPFLNVSVTVAVLAVVLSIALRSAGQPPPAVAEFAPVAQHQIKQAPQEQSSTLGHGAGGAAIGAPVASPQPSPSPPPGTVYSRCVGDPPRQIEDPQSPPCVPFWTGTNNGGATTHGVTSSTIKVVAPFINQTSTSPNSNNQAMEQALVNFFNNRFVFYNRHIEIDWFRYNGNGQATSCNSVLQRGGADEVAQTQGAFASLQYGACGGTSYYPELAHDHTIGVVSAGPDFSSAQLSAMAPYTWQYAMALDNLLRNAGQWACNRVVGQDAVHAGDPSFRTRRRTFGVVVDDGSQGATIDASPLVNALTGCGAKVDQVFQSVNAASAQQAMTQYKADGVTSVFCLCASEGDTLYDGYADNLQYFPEWFTANYLGGQSTTNEFQVWTADQRSSAFGITAVPREVKWQDNPVSWALTEGNPNMDWSTWDSYGNLNAIGGAEEEYRGLLLLASGIQMAGPDLTPQNFAARLQATVFPNPDTPTKEGRVGFGPGGFSMTQDAAEFYFSNTATSTVPQTSGSVCYIDGGARRDLSSWPKGGDPFFPATGNCDSGAYPGQP